MRNIFNFDGPFITGMSRVADLFWLNLLFIICCIPVVTIGAATTALYYVTLKMAKDEEGYVTKAFFKSFIQNLKQATGIWLIFAVIIGVLLADLFIAGDKNLSVSGLMVLKGASSVVLIAVGVMAIIITFILTYVFPILAQFDNTVFNTIKNAFLISVRHLPYTVLFIVIEVVPHVLIYLSVNYGNSIGLLLIFIMFSLVAYIKSKYFNKIFVLYMPKEEVVTTEDDEEKIFTDH